MSFALRDRTTNRPGRRLRSGSRRPAACRQARRPADSSATWTDLILHRAQKAARQECEWKHAARLSGPESGRHPGIDPLPVPAYPARDRWLHDCPEPETGEGGIHTASNPADRPRDVPGAESVDPPSLQRSRVPTHPARLAPTALFRPLRGRAPDWGLRPQPPPRIRWPPRWLVDLPRPSHGRA